jgi:adenine/guanine phosphoribosyltransferase-like PRPP-binding protein
MKKKTKKKKTKKKIIRHEIQTEYLGSVYGKEFLKLVPKAVKKLRSIKRKYPFDAIAFTGSSGAALAYPLSYLLKMPLIHVRKGNSHYGMGKIEGTISSKHYIIVDDFIETGSTIKRIIKNISAETNAKPIGILLYSSGMNNDFVYQTQELPVFTLPRR